MANGIPSVDELMKQNDQRAMRALEQQYNQANSAIEKETNDGLRALNNQYNIKLKAMHTKFKGERDPEKKSAIKKQMIDIRTQFMGKTQAFKDKSYPARRDLTTAAKTEIQKLQSANSKRNLQLQTIRQLAQAGLMNKDAAKKAEYKMVGINWEPPKSQVATLEAEKTAIEDDLRDTREILKRYKAETFWKKGRIKDPVTDKWRNATEEEKTGVKALEAREDQLTADYQSLLMRADPRFRTTIERDRRNRAASKALTGGTRPNLETSIRSTIDKQSKGKRKPITQYSKSRNQTRISYDGGKTWQTQ